MWLKPTKGKVIVCVLVLIIYYLYNNFFSGIVCKPCGTITQEFWPELIPSCNCTIGATFSEFILQLFSYLLLVMFVYFVYSLVQLIRSRLRKA